LAVLCLLNLAQLTELKITMIYFLIFLVVAYLIYAYFSNRRSERIDEEIKKIPRREYLKHWIATTGDKKERASYVLEYEGITRHLEKIFYLALRNKLKEVKCNDMENVRKFIHRKIPFYISYVESLYTIHDLKFSFDKDDFPQIHITTAVNKDVVEYGEKLLDIKICKLSDEFKEDINFLSDSLHGDWMSARKEEYLAKRKNDDGNFSGF
jgi:hypothetical protein